MAAEVAHQGPGPAGLQGCRACRACITMLIFSKGGASVGFDWHLSLSNTLPTCSLPCVGHPHQGASALPEWAEDTVAAILAMTTDPQVSFHW